MKNLVRFQIRDLQQPYVDWLEVYHNLCTTVEAEISTTSLTHLNEAVNHPWNDRSEYVIFDGCSDEHLPTLQGIANKMGCSFQYPCHRDVNAWGDGGIWYHPETTHA